MRSRMAGMAAILLTIYNFLWRDTISEILDKVTTNGLDKNSPYNIPEGRQLWSLGLLS